LKNVNCLAIKAIKQPKQTICNAQMNNSKWEREKEERWCCFSVSSQSL